MLAASCRSSASASFSSFRSRSILSLADSCPARTWPSAAGWLESRLNVCSNRPSGFSEGLSVDSGVVADTGATPDGLAPCCCALSNAAGGWQCRVRGVRAPVRIPFQEDVLDVLRGYFLDASWTSAT